MKKWIYILLLLFAAGNLQAQVDFRTRVSKYKLKTNERLRVNFEVSTQSGSVDERSFVPPNFSNFHKLMGPIMAQEIRTINRKTSAKLTYSYVLQPVKKGKFTIGSAQIVVDGKKYTTKPLNIVVEQGSVVPKTNPGDDHKTNNISVNDKVEKPIVVTEINKTNPYVNEAVLLTYKLYIPQQYGVSNYNETTQPQYNGFWVQNLSKTVDGPYRGDLNGKPYIYYILRKKLLFPQHDGKLTIKPLNLEIDLQVPVVRNFFGMRVRDVELQRVSLTTGKKVLNVKPLPKQGQPIDFSGAVGHFDFKVDVDKNQVQSGEPVNLTLMVKGTGNLKLFDLPRLQAPDGLEVYDPKHSEHIQSNGNGNTGVVKDTYIVIPNSGGKYIIPSMRFVYFDPKTKSYVSKTTGDVIILASGNNTVSNNTSANTPTNTKQYEASDFRFIKEQANFKPVSKKLFFGSKLFNILVSLPFLLAFLFFGYYKYLSNKTYDVGYETMKKRKSLAAKYLKEAKKATADKEAFYAHLEKAIHNFIKAKLGIDTAEMTRDNIRKQLLAKQIDKDKIDDLLDILNRCDAARYAPANTAKITQDLKDAEQVMNTI